MKHVNQYPIFIYGTLLPHEHNHALFGNQIANIEPAIFRGGSLLDCGAYPVLLEGAISEVWGVLVTIKPSAYQTILAKTEPTVTRPTATPSTTVTQIPVSTATAVSPTATQTLPATTTATAVSPTPTPPPAPTTKPDPEGAIFHHITETSPDEAWIATSLLTFVTEPNPYSEYDEMVVGYQTTLTLEYQTNGTSWLVYSELQGAGMGYRIPTITNWGADGQSVTFALVACADGGGNCGQSSPMTVNLMTGEVQERE